MKTIRFCIALTMLVAHTFAASPEGSLSLELVEAPKESYAPYELYLCNNGTGIVSVAMLNEWIQGDIRMTSTNACVVQWEALSDSFENITIGTNDFALVFQEDEDDRILLHSMEAIQIYSFDEKYNLYDSGYKKWWELLPPHGSVIFVYDIPEAYGKRFRVWSGRLETGPFTISYGRIHLSSEEDSESKTTQGLARPPITLGATLKEILKRYGEPAWWRELIYPQRIIGTYRDEDFDFQFEFFTNKTEKPVLGKISYIVPDSELTEALIQQVLKNHSSGHEWIKGPSGHKYRRDGARATLNSNTISVTSDEYTTFREEGSEETLRSWRIPPSQIQSQEYGIYPPLYRMQKSRIEKRMDEARKRREKQRKEEAN